MPVMAVISAVRNDKTPVIVERLVNDIDDIVKNVRFDGWQNTTEGRKIVKKAITEIIGIKYKIKDKVLLKKAYDYVEAYY
jgi:type I restriction enzyme R subunit